MVNSIEKYTSTVVYLAVLVFTPKSWYSNFNAQLELAISIDQRAHYNVHCPETVRVTSPNLTIIELSD